MAHAPSTPHESALTALRAATSAAHAELDRRLSFDAGALTRSRYVRFLRASSAVVGPLEAAIARWLGPAEDGCSRAAAVREDLSALGERQASPGAVPALRSVAEAMGASYVVEGSALGGVVLARTVVEALGPSAPRRYLSLRGDGTARRWREFVRALESWGGTAEGAARRSACESAVATFAAYTSAFVASGALA